MPEGYSNEEKETPSIKEIFEQIQSELDFLSGVEITTSLLQWKKAIIALEGKIPPKAIQELMDIISKQYKDVKIIFEPLLNSIIVELGESNEEIERENAQEYLASAILAVYTELLLYFKGENIEIHDDHSMIFVRLTDENKNINVNQICNDILKEYPGTSFACLPINNHIVITIRI